MKKYLIFLLIITALSCKKEVVDKTPELLSKSWKMIAWTVLTPLQGTPLNGISQNWMGASTCVSDKIQTFKLDGIFVHEKTLTCNNDEDYNGVWTLTENNKVINVKYIGGGPIDFKYNIIELTNTKLKVQRLEKTGVGGTQIMELLMQYEFEPK